MSESPITVTYSLEEILKDINGKLDKIDEKFEAKFDKIEAKFDKIELRLTNLEVGQTKLNTEVENLKEEVRDIKNTQNSLVQEVADLKGVKSLIIPIVVAVATALLTLLFRILPNSFGQSKVSFLHQISTYDVIKAIAAKIIDNRKESPRQ